MSMFSVGIFLNNSVKTQLILRTFGKDLNAMWHGILARWNVGWNAAARNGFLGSVADRWRCTVVQAVDNG